jgi:hypothetical protein
MALKIVNRAGKTMVSPKSGSPKQADVPTIPV